MTNDKEWHRVTKCPACGGQLIISEHYTFSRDYMITSKGILSKRFSKSDLGSLDCITAFCPKCETAFDADAVVIEADGSVWLKCP